MGDKKKSVISIVLAAIFDPERQRLLLLKRRKPPYVGYWGLPGGKLEPGETVPAAALREAEEETGLCAVFSRVAGVATETIRGTAALGDEAGEVRHHFVIFVVELLAQTVEFSASEEGELTWFDLKEIALPESRIIPTDRDLIGKLVLVESELRVAHYEIREKDDCAEPDYGVNW